MSSENVGGVHDDGKLWGGRFTGGPDPALERISRSPARSFELAPEDVRGSIAHLGELERCGILTADETLAKRYLELGALFVAVGIDVNLLTKNARALAQRFKTA